MRRASLMPRVPVAQLALPLFTTIVRAWPLATASRVT